MEFSSRNINEALSTIARTMIVAGRQVPSRNGDTLEIQNAHVTLTSPEYRECVIPERRASLPAQIAETVWVLAGRNDIGWLSHYLPRAADFSDDGETWRAGYGPRLRNWGADTSADGIGIDQLEAVVSLLREDPETRRAVISLWDPTADTVPGKDIACNNWLHFLVREGALHLHVTTRSNDFMWGWSGINAFEWSVLLEVVAKLVGVPMGMLHFSISSFHVYRPYFAKAERIANTETSALKRGAYPKRGNPARYNTQTLEGLSANLQAFFQAEEQIRTQYGRVEPRALAAVTDPMLREWLDVLRWWWGDDAVELSGWTKIAADLSPGRPLAQALTVDKGRVEHLESVIAAPSSLAGSSLPVFKTYVTELHSEKHAAYGDSWKRRGESVSIMANLARKVDRLGGGETRDETSADTAIDLLCYTAKYDAWLYDLEAETSTSDGDAEPNALILQQRRSSRYEGRSDADLVALAQERFEELLKLVEGVVDIWQRREKNLQLLHVAFELAYRLWLKDQA